MATVNPFDLLGDDDNDDPSQLIAKQQEKLAAAVASPAPAKLPSKTLPPSQAVKEARGELTAAPSHGGAVRGRVGHGNSPNRDVASNGDINEFSGTYAGVGEDGELNKPSERGRGTYGPPRQSVRGGRRGGYGNGEARGDPNNPPRRQFDRHSGTVRGTWATKRDGAGRGNWGPAADEILAQELEEMMKTEDKMSTPDKQPEQENALPSDANKENEEVPANGVEKEPDNKEMTLAEYEKILEEKRKSLTVTKTEERKVDLDKEFEFMQLLSIKKENDDVFIKSGSGKDSAKQKENANGVEKVKKSQSINEFLKPAEGERYYSPGGRGRGRGRGDRRNFGGDFGGGSIASVPAAPSIEDEGQFPTLGGK